MTVVWIFLIQLLFSQQKMVDKMEGNRWRVGYRNLTTVISAQRNSTNICTVVFFQLFLAKERTFSSLIISWRHAKFWWRHKPKNLSKMFLKKKKLWMCENIFVYVRAHLYAPSSHPHKLKWVSTNCKWF